MTNIEFVKIIVYGNLISPSPLTDSALDAIIQSQGVNSCIEILARAQLVLISNQPTSVNDGAVSMSWQNRKSALEDVIKKAEQGLFIGPEEDLKKPIESASVPI